MKVKTKAKCSGCGEDTIVAFKKPDYFTPTVSTYTCECCGSLLKFTVKKLKQKNMVDVTTSLVRVSEKLLQHIEDTQKELKNETL